MESKRGELRKEIKMKVDIQRDWWKILSALIALSLVLTLIRSCGEEKWRLRAERAEARADLIQTELKKTEIVYKSDREDWEKKILELQGNVDSAYTVIARLEGDVVVSDGRRADAEADLALAKTDAERVPILSGLYDEAKTEINTLKEARKEDAKIIFSINEKYEGEHKLRLDSESMYAGAQKVIAEKDGALRAKDKIILKLELKGKLKFWGGAAGSALAFGLGLLVGK